MNWQLIILSVLQSALLAGGQILLKISMQNMPHFQWTWECIKAYLLNFWFLLTGICFGAATALWMYLIKNYPLSQAYPLTSLAYVFGLLAAIVVFHETAGFEKWLGVILILLGAFFLTKQ
ncbi:MAG: EamA family transporter [Candidatus Cryptobacteroides sp.]